MFANSNSHRSWSEALRRRYTSGRISAEVGEKGGGKKLPFQHFKIYISLIVAHHDSRQSVAILRKEKKVFFFYLYGFLTQSKGFLHPAFELSNSSPFSFLKSLVIPILIWNFESAKIHDSWTIYYTKTLNSEKKKNCLLFSRSREMNPRSFGLFKPLCFTEKKCISTVRTYKLYNMRWETFSTHFQHYFAFFLFFSHEKNYSFKVNICRI